MYKKLCVVGLLAGCLSFVSFGIVACGKKNEVYQQYSAPKETEKERPLGSWMFRCKNPVNGKCECPETKAVQGATALCAVILSSASSSNDVTTTNQEE